jgi:class 3 adenylate cyclase
MVTNVPPHTENMIEECSMVCHFALDLVQALRDFNYGYKGKQLDLRVGLNIGDVVAGVVGTKRFLYDVSSQGLYDSCKIFAWSYGVLQQYSYGEMQ